jgi:deoxyribodipyrimidine photolyase
VVRHYSDKTSLIRRRLPTSRNKKPASRATNGHANGHDYGQDVRDARAELKLAIANVEHLQKGLADLKQDLAECKQEIYDFYASERKKLEKEGMTLFKHEADIVNDEIRNLRQERKELEAEVRDNEKKLKAAETLAQKAAHTVIRLEGHAQRVYEEACQLANKLTALVPELQVCLRDIVRRPTDPMHFQSLPANEKAFFESVSSFVNNPLNDTFIKTDNTENTRIFDYVNRLTLDPDATL